VTLGGNPVLRDLSFAVPEGLSVAIVGQSGTGKTTLLRAIAGLIKPTSGEVFIDGSAPAELYGSAKLAFLFQEAYLWQHLTVRQNLELIYQVHRRPVDETHLISQLKTVGLQDATDLYPFQLSVGMKARAAIARALCLPPQVLLMDEPFAGLDPVRRTELNKTIQTTCHRLGATSLWVTHDVVEALMFGDLVMAMAPSKVIELFDTRSLPHVTDAGILPEPVRSLRDRIISVTSGTPDCITGVH
jgi:NitT/TauT family transport system ATP-binding protein